MDAELDGSASAPRSGLKAKLINSDFETIIPGLAAGRYDLGMSSFTDTKEREKTVDFVDYFSAGISFYAKRDGEPGRAPRVADLCGKTVAAEKGTVEAEEAEAQSKKCTKEGKKAVTTLELPGPERGQPRGLERARGSGHGRLAGRRLPGQAVQRRSSS